MGGRFSCGHLLKLVHHGGEPMKKIMLICCLITFYFPSQALAQAILDDCLDIFDDAMVLILASANSIDGKFCATDKGQVILGFNAPQTGKPDCHFEASSVNTMGLKRCRTRISSCVQDSSLNLVSTGKTLSQWKKFLKGEGCQIVLNVQVPPPG